MSRETANVIKEETGRKLTYSEGKKKVWKCSVIVL